MVGRVGKGRAQVLVLCDMDCTATGKGVFGVRAWAHNLKMDLDGGWVLVMST